MKIIYKVPIPGIRIGAPKTLPRPEEVIIGYELVDANYEKKLFKSAKPKRMNVAGWVSVALLAIFCWPLSCAPCFMTCSYSEYQRPVYGNK